MELREIITYGGYFERFFDGLYELQIELALTLKRCYYEEHPEEVKKIIREGSERARIEAQRVLAEVRKLVRMY